MQAKQEERRGALEQNFVVYGPSVALAREADLPCCSGVIAEFLLVLAHVEEALQQILAGGETVHVARLLDQVFRSMSRLYRQAAEIGMDGLCDLAYEIAQAFGSINYVENADSQRLARLARLALVAVEQMRHLLTPESRESKNRRVRRTVLALLTT